ncbi:MAG: serine hydrolase domain-containing protein [Pyrinomonadaceae bacterium]
MFHKIPVLLISLLFFVVVTQFVTGQSNKAKKVDEFVSQFVKAGQFGGVIVASENGKVIYEKAFGLANAEHKVSNQLDTRIGIASITKPMTAVILNRLIEAGKMAATDKISKYIPDFPNGEKITIEMIASHRSGIPHRVMPPEAEAVPYTSAEFIEKVKLAKLAFEPGTQRLYSSAGYAVLARALEIASGKTYSQLLQEYVFDPAGMTDSLTFSAEPVMERRAQDYFFTPEGLINVPLKDYSFLVGAGSVFGTASDLHKFGQALIAGRYGENAKTSLVGSATFVSTGSTNGHRSALEIEKNNKYGYVILSNLAGAFDLISQGVQEIMQGKELTAKTISFPKIIPNPNKDLNEFLGHFKRSDNGGETDVTLKNGYLFASDIKLYPIRPDCFFDYRFYGEACFIRDAGGKFKEIRWKGIGFDLTWIKQ